MSGGANITSCSGSHLSAPAAKPLGSGGSSHKAIVRHRLIVAETYHELADDFPDQPGLIALIGINGGVEPFQFFAFHGGIYGH